MNTFKRQEKTEVLLRFQASDPEKSERLKNRLKRQLKEYENIKILKVDAEPLPKGAMSGDAITIGVLALAVLPNLIPTIINAIKDIKLGNQGTSINIKIKDGDREVQIEIPSDLNHLDEITALTDMYLEKLKR